jgi:hypothetical protein
MVSPMFCLPCRFYLVLGVFAMVRGNMLDLFRVSYQRNRPDHNASWRDS